MRGIVIALLVAGLALSAGILAGQESGDEEALAAIVQTYVDAWNQSDIDTIAGLYADDAKLIDLTGEVVTGKDAIRDAVTETRETYAGGTLAATVTAVRFVRPHIAVVDGEWSVTGIEPPAEGAAPPTEGQFTLVGQKLGDAWLVVAEQSKVPVRPPASAEE